MISKPAVPIDAYFNLVKNPDNNYTFLPIYNQKYYNFYKKQIAVFWTAEEIDLSKDRDHFLNKLTDPERFFIINIFSLLRLLISSEYFCLSSNNLFLFSISLFFCFIIIILFSNILFFSSIYFLYSKQQL